MEVTATSHPCLLPSVPFSLLHLHTHYYPPGMAISALLAFLLLTEPTRGQICITDSEPLKTVMFFLII